MPRLPVAATRLGARHDATAALARARDAYDRLPAAYAIASYASATYVALDMFERPAPRPSRHRTATRRDRSPSREAIAHLDLAAALAGLGEPEEAARLGAAALDSPRVVDSVVARIVDVGRPVPRLPAAHNLQSSVVTLTRREGTATTGG
jgi:hypothetical protein